MSVINDYALQLSAEPIATIPDFVSARKGNKPVWPVLTGISIAQVEIPVGKWRAPHYHTNTPELLVIIQGTARAYLVTPSPGNKLIEIDLKEGDCVYFPMGWPHWLCNTGKVEVRTYFNYGHEQPVTFEVPNIVAHYSGKEMPVFAAGRINVSDSE